MKKIYLLLSLAFIAVGAIAELDLPKAPDGYKWIKILNDKSALLQPDGWFYREDHLKNTDAYFVSKEDIGTQGKFSTGLSLNVLYTIDERKGVPPSEYAQSAIKRIQESNTAEVVKSSTDKAGGFVRMMGKVRIKHPEGAVFNHYLYLANDQTGTLWCYVFESPEEEWDNAWEIGTTMMKLIVVDSDI